MVLVAGLCRIFNVLFDFSSNGCWPWTFERSAIQPVPRSHMTSVDGSSTKYCIFTRIGKYA